MNKECQTLSVFLTFSDLLYSAKQQSSGDGMRVPKQSIIFIIFPQSLTQTKAVIGYWKRIQPSHLPELLLNCNYQQQN
mgnify:CR=1 FL=1